MASFKIITYSIALLVGMAISGCQSQPAFVPANPNTAPTCEELRAAFRAVQSGFESVRSKVEVTKANSIYRLFSTSLTMRGSSSCVVRRYGSRDDLYCRWEAGVNSALMGSYYRSIRDQLLSCLKEASVSQDDRGGSTRVVLDSTKGNITFWVMAHYQDTPYYVYLSVRN